MDFARQLRDGVRRGRIRCSVRVWIRPRVKPDGRYRMDDGHIVVDSIAPLRRRDLTDDLARESGFGSVKALLETARHGRGENIYLIRFHYVPPGGWDAPTREGPERSGADAARERQALLRRIRASTPAGSAGAARPSTRGTRRPRR